MAGFLTSKQEEICQEQEEREMMMAQDETFVTTDEQVCQTSSPELTVWVGGVQGEWMKCMKIKTNSKNTTIQLSS